MKMFVYGGLLKGMTLSPFMEDSRFLGPALTYANLYFFGQFPGINHGKDIVYGEIYEIDESLLPGLDKIEDYHPENPEKSTYYRKQTTAISLLNGKRYMVQAYYYKLPIKDQQKIEHGDYRRFINEYDKQACWVINSSLITNKIEVNLFNNVDILIEGTVQLSELNSKNEYNKKVYLAKLNKEQIAKLDIKVEVPNKYMRVSIPFKTKNGETECGFAYFSTEILRNGSVISCKGFTKLF